MQKITKYINYLILFGLIGFLGLKIFQMNKINNQYEILLNENSQNLYKIHFYDDELKTLKNKNKELYDSIKIYKDEIDYLIQFKYKKEYKIDTVYINNKKDDNLKEKVFEYTNEPNDTLNYNLKIGSYIEPNWYSMNFSISEQFTIINKKYNDINETTIDTKTNSTTINDVIVLKQNNNKFIDNFYFGPSITAGYDIINKNMGVMFGLSVSYKIPLKK